MKVLFVCSGNSKNFDIAPFIKSQANSLDKRGADVEYFLIKGKGFQGYLKNIFPLRRQIRNNDYDLIHSHYSLSGWVTQLSLTKTPKIVSYMGSDTYGNIGKGGKLKPSGWINILSAKTLQFGVERIIVKSSNLKDRVTLKQKAKVVPNGVNTDKFKPTPKKIAKKKLNLQVDKEAHYVLFLGSKTSERKNFELLRGATGHLNNTVNVLAPYPIPPNQVPLYLNATDALALTSHAEGSPNVVKEAMACNTPIVSTDVGDVGWVINGTDGCYLSSFDPRDYANQLEKALEFPGKTNGRKRIMELGLDTESVAERLINIYREVISK